MSVVARDKKRDRIDDRRNELERKKVKSKKKQRSTLRQRKKGGLLLQQNQQKRCHAEDTQIQILHFGKMLKKNLKKF